jgi:hypothetical protein
MSARPRPPASLVAAEPGIGAWSILHAYRGSIAHGMHDPHPGSIDDIDTMSLCVPPLDYYFGLAEYGRRGTLEIKADPWDIVTYEIRKALTLLLQGNPNVMSILWLPPDLYLKLTPAGRLLVERRDLFIGRHVYAAFAGYANGQLQKMTQGIYRAHSYGVGGEVAQMIDRDESRIELTEGDAPEVLVAFRGSGVEPATWLNTTFGIVVRWDHPQATCWTCEARGAFADRLLRHIRRALRVRREHADIARAAHESLTTRYPGPLTDAHRVKYQTYRDRLAEPTAQEPDRDEGPERYAEAYAGERRRELFERFGYDTKNAAHLIRLLRMCVEVMQDGVLVVHREDRDELLGIKYGEWSLEQVQRHAGELFDAAQSAHDRSTLRAEPDRRAIADLCVDIVQAAHAER